MRDSFRPLKIIHSKLEPFQNNVDIENIRGKIFSLNVKLGLFSKYFILYSVYFDKTTAPNYLIEYLFIINT